MLIFHFLLQFALGSPAYYKGPVPSTGELPTSETDFLSFLVIGDWGEPTNLQSEKLDGSAMNTVAQQMNSSFVVAVGDNFYNAGVTGVDDPKFQEVWNNVYNGPTLKNLPWYVVMGNHDWYGSRTAQIEYAKLNPRWIMPDLFYTKTFNFAGKVVAMVFIDTNLLHYGYNGTGEAKFPGNQLLPNFIDQGWTPDSNELENQLDWIKSQLNLYSDSDYLFVAGHHDLVTCGNNATGMLQLKDMMEEFKVSAYFFGHKHALGTARMNGVVYVQSGAGGQKEDACPPPSGTTDAWSEGNIFGFASVKVSINNFTVDFIKNDASDLFSITGTSRG